MTKSNGNDLSALKREVGALLYAFHTGRERSVTSKQLAQRLNQHPDRIRVAISEMVTEAQPIGSVRDGYFVIANPQEATECYRHLDSRARKIFRRLAGLRRGVVAKFGNQLNLDLPNCHEVHDPENVPARPFA